MVLFRIFHRGAHLDLIGVCHAISYMPALHFSYLIILFGPGTPDLVLPNR